MELAEDCVLKTLETDSLLPCDFSFVQPDKANLRAFGIPLVARRPLRTASELPSLRDELHSNGVRLIEKCRSMSSCGKHGKRSPGRQVWKCEIVASGRRLVLKLFHGPLGNYAQFPPEETFAQDIYYYGQARNKYRPLAKRYDLRTSLWVPPFANHPRMQGLQPCREAYCPTALASSESVMVYLRRSAE